MLGCIPRSPSPAIDISDDETGIQVLDRAGAAPIGVKEEVQNLRVSIPSHHCILLQTNFAIQARLALLEGSTNIKSESKVAVKREREDNEGSNPRQRPRKSAKIETVDLTDD